MPDPLGEAGPILNAYPDSIGENLADLVEFLNHPDVVGAFSSVYVLPSIFNSDLDRGFSVIDYDLNSEYATRADIEALKQADLSLKLDFILNHASVQSPQFQDLLANGEKSQFTDFFIDWNEFWDGHGELTEDGYVQPRAELIEDMFFRKPGLPILMVRMPDGSQKPYWNTFYQEIREPEPDAIDQTTTYLGQMDLNIKSPLVWEFYAETLHKLAGYGAEIVRLDAFAYAPKEPGERNFLNDPGTWDLLDEVKQLADEQGLKLLPEIHASYSEGIHEVIAAKGFMTYDFFLPGLLIDAFESANTTTLRGWIGELLEKEIRTVNMLGCHDGIPMLDLRGLLADERIDELIEALKDRGGHVKDLHGQKQMYYQVNTTYYSALGESDAALLLARAIQVFMPGKPQVWYLDLLAGTNDHAAVERAGAGGHKEINRTNLTAEHVNTRLAEPVVQRQLELLRFRSDCPAFGFDATCEVVDTPPEQLHLIWRNHGHTAELKVNLADLALAITSTDDHGRQQVFSS